MKNNQNNKKNHKNKDCGNKNCGDKNGDKSCNNHSYSHDCDR